LFQRLKNPPAEPPIDMQQNLSGHFGFTGREKVIKTAFSQTSALSNPA